MNGRYSDRFRLIKLGQLPKEAVPKPKKRIKPIGDKKMAEMKAEKAQRGDNPTELQYWFMTRMKYMTGQCAATSLPTNRVVYKKAINSICHILSQQQCPSVMCHPMNWIELEENFHKKFDAMSWKEREQLKCWPLIRERLIMVWPDLAEDERRHFPESVLKYMEKQKPF